MYYILKNREPVEISDVRVWGEWYRSADCKVMRTYKEEGNADDYISTVFLGIDHGFGGEPMHFETMVFDEDGGDYEKRCRTWEEAEAQHCAMVKEFYGRDIQPPTKPSLTLVSDDPELNHERWS